jgi:hypothetical protein
MKSSPTWQTAYFHRSAETKRRRSPILNDHNDPVDFQFVGVQGLRCLDPQCELDEVWYDIRELLAPMERKGAIFPTDDELIADC